VEGAAPFDESPPPHAARMAAIALTSTDLVAIESMMRTPRGKYKSQVDVFEAHVASTAGTNGGAMCPLT